MAKNNLKIEIIDQTGQKVKEQVLNSDIFGLEINTDLVHQAVVTQLANRRQNLSHTKQRSEIRGGGRKPWRQKGTGRARHGSIRSPLWIGGGVTFGPTKERNFSKKINQKMKRKALLMCLSDKLSSNLLILVDNLEVKEFKTKQIAQILDKILPQQEKNKKIKEVDSKTKKAEIKDKKVKFRPSCLMVLGDKDEKMVKSVRNIDKIKIIRAENLNVLDILKYQYFLTTLRGLEKINEIYSIDKKDVKKDSISTQK